MTHFPCTLYSGKLSLGKTALVESLTKGCAGGMPVDRGWTRASVSELQCRKSGEDEVGPILPAWAFFENSHISCPRIRQETGNVHCNMKEGWNERLHQLAAELSLSPLPPRALEHSTNSTHIELNLWSSRVSRHANGDDHDCSGTKAHATGYPDPRPPSESPKL